MLLIGTLSFQCVFIFFTTKPGVENQHSYQLYPSIPYFPSLPAEETSHLLGLSHSLLLI